MANLSEFGDQTRGRLSDAVDGFRYCKAAFGGDEAPIAVLESFEDVWHTADQAERLSIPRAVVTITFASVACWAALVGAALIFV